MSNKKRKITDIRHPTYLSRISDWIKWRLTYEGGRDFIFKYLQRYSKRETHEDFRIRKGMTHCPAFAKASINDIKNAIFQRMTAVVRKGGPESYQSAIEGKSGGVDLEGSTMNNFIGRNVITELITMSKVGIWIDMPEDIGKTVIEKGKKHPYLYVYRAEDILSWASADYDDPRTLTSVLLKDTIYGYDDETGLPNETIVRYRLARIIEDDGIKKVEVKFYDKDGQQIDNEGETSTEASTLEVSEIPFVMFELTDSLLADVADYQVTLLNLDSSDTSYIHKSNFPFYTEQYDPRQNPYAKRPEQTKEVANSNATDGSAATVLETEHNKGAVSNIDIGVSQGRRYPLGTDRPEFIAPPTEPLEASMAKQNQLKEDIRTLVGLSLTQIQSKMASAESKEVDERGLEAGLSYIGLELQHGENQVSEIWAMYEGTDDTAIVKYPEKYSLKSDEDKRRDAKVMLDLINAIPSREYRKEMAKLIASNTMGAQVEPETIEKINKELEGAVAYITPEVMEKAIENGYLTAATAAQLLGLPADEVEKAKKEHAERLARIQKAQTGGARGVDDLSPEPKRDAKDEKKISQDGTRDDDLKDKTRGDGK